MKKDTRHRRYMLTINNPCTVWTHDVIKDILTNQMSLKYWCMADEQGLEESTPHTHIYFVVERSPVGFSRVKKLFPTAHIEPARGTSEECRDYIGKFGKWNEDAKAETSIEGTFEEWGELPEELQGNRSDWDLAYTMLENGYDVLEVINAQRHLAKYINTLERLKQEFMYKEYSEIFREMEVTFIQGPTGYGKTSLVTKTYGYRNICEVSNYGHGGCFDNYKYQDVLVFDEFNSSLEIPKMNVYLDGHPHMLPARYHNRGACYTKAFIISNIPLEQHYQTVQEKHPAVWDAFIRRINKVLVFTDVGKYDTYTTEEYFESVRQGVAAVE